MTDPAKAAPMREDVTQADREAAADILDAASALIGNELIVQIADLIRKGAYNDHEVVHVVKRHRLANTARPDIGERPPMDGEGADERLKKAYQVQQADVPDQTALVWRSDLLDMFHRYWNLEGSLAARPDAGDEDVERVARALCLYDYPAQSARWHDNSWPEFADAARAALAAMREGVDRGMVEREALDVLRMVVAFEDSRTTSKDAPGHSHLKRGIWDSDNVPGLAGQPCEWCALWERARTLARAPLPAPPAKDTI